MPGFTPISTAEGELKTVTVQFQQTYLNKLWNKWKTNTFRIN